MCLHRVVVAWKWTLGVGLRAVECGNGYGGKRLVL
jgi:hypothetical protein